MGHRLVKTLQEDLQALKACLGTFSARDMMTHAAALSYYMVFSFPPMLFIVLWIAGGLVALQLAALLLNLVVGILLGFDG